ncbi:MAG: low specificity L-threonine aldolase [Vicinamibacterales bacterium]
MARVNRRRFLELGAASGALGLTLPAGAASQQPAAAQRPSDVAADRTVYLTGDGVPHSPAQYAHLLARLTDEQGVAADNYILGGVVEELEAKFAQILGKEAAVFIPTGTLANHLAIRILAGSATPSRAIVQSESHIYQDSGDCVQTLSSITLMPLAPGRATFTAADVQQLVDQTKSGRVARPIPVMSIESPVRRRAGEIFDRAELGRVLEVAKTNGIRAHLDGARLFIEAAYANRPITEYTAPFDTVYVSLYKYFNAASGAVLAGPRALLQDLFHTRRMFGGGLYQAWPFAAVALHYADGFADRLRKAIPIAEELATGLERLDGVSVRRIPNGTNLFGVQVPAARAAALRERLAADGIRLGAPAANGGFTVGVNETMARSSADALLDAFTRGLA